MEGVMSDDNGIPSEKLKKLLSVMTMALKKDENTLSVFKIDYLDIQASDTVAWDFTSGKFYPEPPWF